MKKIMNRNTLLLYCLALLIMNTLGCSPSSDKTTTPTTTTQSSTPNLNGTLTLRLPGEPTNLNPILSTDAYASNVQGLIFNGLFRVNDSLDLEPDLIDSYTIKNNGTHYIFHLKKDVTWHDGKPFTSEDVVYTFNTILNPKTNTVRRSNFMINGKPIRFKAIDTHTVSATLPEPFAPFLTRMTFEIIPKHVYENEDINTSKYNQHPIGTGPFTFKLWKSAQYIIVQRNPNYHGKTPKLSQIIYKIIPDTNTALVALEKGELDSSAIPSKEYDNFKKQTHINTFTYEQLQYSYIGFNLDHPDFKNPLVRRAFTHAINKDILIKKIHKGFAAAAHIPASPVSWAYPNENEIPLLEFNQEKAKALLKKAGYTLNEKTNLLEKNGTPLTFTLLMGKGSRTGEQTAEIIQQYLKLIGIQMNIQQLEWQSFLKIINSPDTNKKFDAAMLGWSLGLDPDGYAIWHSSQYPKGFNFIHYSNPKVDSLLIQGRRETNQEKRKKLYKKLYQEIGQDAPYIFLVYPVTIAGVNARVQGLSKPGPAGLFNQIEDVFVTD